MHFRYSFRHLSFRILLWPLVCTIICFCLITSLNSMRSDFWRQRFSGWYLNQRIIPTFLTIRTTYFAFVRTKIRARYVVLSFVSVCPWSIAQLNHTKRCPSICNQGFPPDSSRSSKCNDFIHRAQILNTQRVWNRRARPPTVVAAELLQKAFYTFISLNVHATHAENERRNPHTLVIKDFHARWPGDSCTS